ncbi:hypothetical protein IWZ03DRAFT_162525 [Phyllosticta citriasiana]|uniref:Uncharacterized protein n=1 Tax=Phyllosticta citriasiana TaxID=595635 RepID=A0ABR1KQ30_9PEZI
MSSPRDVDRDHELPHWSNLPSDTTTSINNATNMSVNSPASPPPPPFFPPAPILASVHASTARLKQTRQLPDAHVLLRRREQQLHDELQDLLFAQEEALAEATGVGTAGKSETVDLSGSLTPTVQSLTMANVNGNGNRAHSERRQSPRVKMGVNAARKGIRRAMRKLAAVKDQESKLLDGDKAGSHAVLEQLKVWDERKEKLNKQIHDIETGDHHSRTDRLRNEATLLEGEISELEEKLRVMKTRHRELLSEISEIDNSVQSKLSSYKTSLSLLESDINNFLRRAPPRDRGGAGGHGDAPFYKMPPKRRTLELAKDHYHDELEAVQEQQAELTRERNALEEGATIWSDILRAITALERHIASATAHLASSSEDSTAEAKNLLRHFEDTTAHLEAQIDAAEERGWKLLVACVGAELAALHQGRRFLEDMVGEAEGLSPTVEREKLLGDVDVEFAPSSGAASPRLRDGSNTEGGAANNRSGGLSSSQRTMLPVRSSSGSSLVGKSAAAAAAAADAPPGEKTRVKEYQSTDEDEPDPELLTSHQDTDDDLR